MLKLSLKSQREKITTKYLTFKRTLVNLKSRKVTERRLWNGIRINISRIAKGRSKKLK